MREKDTEYLMRTLGKEVVKKWCACERPPMSIAQYIDKADDERLILYVLCRISRQLEDVVSALKRKEKP